MVLSPFFRVHAIPASLAPYRWGSESFRASVHRRIRSPRAGLCRSRTRILVSCKLPVCCGEFGAFRDLRPGTRPRRCWRTKKSGAHGASALREFRCRCRRLGWARGFYRHVHAIPVNDRSASSAHMKLRNPQGGMIVQARSLCYWGCTRFSGVSARQGILVLSVTAYRKLRCRSGYDLRASLMSLSASRTRISDFHITATLVHLG
jgi:hypothetical protein